MQDHQQIWEIYTAAWKTETASEKQALFEQSLALNCEYHDPLIRTKGYDELETYMLEFHLQVPGGHFMTTHFYSHTNKSITSWEMRNGEDVKIGDGMSYGEYNELGKLISMTGFYEVPPVE